MCLSLKHTLYLTMFVLVPFLKTCGKGMKNKQKKRKKLTSAGEMPREITGKRRIPPADE